MEMQGVLMQMSGLFSENSKESNVSNKKTQGKGEVAFSDYMTNVKPKETIAYSEPNTENRPVVPEEVKNGVVNTQTEKVVTDTETVEPGTEMEKVSSNIEPVIQEVQMTQEEKVSENIIYNSDNLFVIQKASLEWTEEVEEVLCEELSISQEELEDIMAELGIQLVDLQSMSNIQQLVLTVAGTDDKTALLTNELLAMQTVSIKETMEQITSVVAQEYGVKDEEITDFLIQDIQPEEFDISKETVDLPDLQEEKQMGKSDMGNVISDEIPEDMWTKSSDTEQETKKKIPMGTVLDGRNAAEKISEPGKGFTEPSLKTESEPVVKEETLIEDMEMNMAMSKEEKIQITADKDMVQSKPDVMETKTEPKIEITIEKDNTVVKENPQSNEKEFTDSDSSHEKQGTQNLFEHFVEHLSVNRANDIEQTDMKIDTVAQMREIVTQVVEQIKVRVNVDASSMEVQLNPENLGKVNLTVVAKDGHITAHFVTETELARQALEGQVQQLRENLREQGLKVDEVEVSISNFDFSHSNQANAEEQRQQHNQEQRRLHRNLNLNEAVNLKDLSEEEQLAARIMSDNGNQVDYIA